MKTKDPRVFYPDKKVLITGGLGFIGSSLAIALVRSGAEVTLLDCFLENHGANPANIEDIKSEVRVLDADIRDSSAMHQAVKGQDLIFNIAGQTSHMDSMRDPFLDNEINTRGHLVLLEACRKQNSEVKVVYCGSRAQYGTPAYLPVDEDCPMRPLDIYGADKLTGETYHFLYQTICGLRAVSLRVNNTYGPRHQMRHDKYGVQNYLLRLAMDDQTITVYGDGQQLRDLNYIDDVVEAFMLAGASDKADGHAYNLGSEHPVVFVELVLELIRAAGSGRYKFAEYPKSRAQIETGDYVADIGKIRTDLGWEPEVELKLGLQRTVEFYRKHKAKYWE